MPETALQVTSLDGRELKIPLDHVVIPGGLKTVRGEGMPLSKTPSVKGELRISFDIQFPLSLSKDQKAALRTALTSA